MLGEDRYELGARVACVMGEPERYSVLCACLGLQVGRGDVQGMEEVNRGQAEAPGGIRTFQQGIPRKGGREMKTERMDKGKQSGHVWIALDKLIEAEMERVEALLLVVRRKEGFLERHEHFREGGEVD